MKTVNRATNSYNCNHYHYQQTLQNSLYRPISQTMFMLSIAINRVEHVYATVIIKHNYMLMCKHKIVINRIYISQDLLSTSRPMATRKIG